ncbi:MAG: type II toxin-antitoxin system RelE/ParE family toxin [Armatimonadota bacterium]
MEQREQPDRRAYRVEDPQRRIPRYCKRQPAGVAEAIRQACAAVAQDPYKPTAQRCVVHHLRGQFRCCREFRKLPDNRRLFYQVDDETRVVTIVYVGPHP